MMQGQAAIPTPMTKLECLPCPGGQEISLIGGISVLTKQTFGKSTILWTSIDPHMISPSALHHHMFPCSRPGREPHIQPNSPRVDCLHQTSLWCDPIWVCETSKNERRCTGQLVVGFWTALGVITLQNAHCPSCRTKPDQARLSTL